MPSGLRISQITLAGTSPLRRARSIPASVCPARVRTPPGCAIIGKTWPGVTISFALAFSRTAVCMVLARSAAEIPVVTPSAASIEMVKLVLYRELFWLTIKDRFNCLQRSSVSARQISPRPCPAMKLMSLALTNSAAITRSPSFSRSSSSTSITILPRR